MGLFVKREFILLMPTLQTMDEISISPLWISTIYFLIKKYNQRHFTLFNKIICTCGEIHLFQWEKSVILIGKLYSLIITHLHHHHHHSFTFWYTYTYACVGKVHIPQTKISFHTSTIYLIHNNKTSKWTLSHFIGTDSFPIVFNIYVSVDKYLV